MHIDTGHNFEETIQYRDDLAGKTGTKMIVKYVQDSIDKGRAVEEKGVNASRNVLQTVTLLDAIEEMKFDCAMGGGRRDEEKARAKERFFSHRDSGDLDRTLFRGENTDQQSEQGRFSRAVGADHRNRPSFFDIDADSGKRLIAVRVCIA